MNDGDRAPGPVPETTVAAGDWCLYTHFLLFPPILLMMSLRALIQVLLLLFPVAGLIAADDTADRVPRLSALATEDSPYLRQHIDSPVNWRPWGPAAFDEAEQTMKPLFVSIGYFSCHWCASMERETFRDPATAALLNEKFINVKVDRFERPDLDRFLMRYIEQSVRGGGWPLNVWTTPDRLPWRGVSYMSNTDDDRGTFADFASHTARLWDEDHPHLTSKAAVDMENFRRIADPPPLADFALKPVTLDLAFTRIAGQFDPVHGGFGRVPKFPSPTRLEFLAHHWAAQEPGSGTAEKCAAMIEATLRGMARGALRDHLGGGFFRYALDEAWRRPYFEKMALDQAMMAQSYLTGYLLIGQDEHASVAREILEYADRELSHPEGGFCNAEHCESLTEATRVPVEGAYYAWNHSRFRESAAAAADVLEEVFDIRERGNIPPGTDPRDNLGGLNLLSEVRPLAEAARRLGIPGPRAAALFEQGRAALIDARSNRSRPARDSLLITQMNGALISAFARAAMVLGDDTLLARAQRCARFVRARLWHEKSQALYRCCTDRSPKHPACAEDYAFLVAGALDLYEATGERAWLEWAESLQRSFDAHYRDEKNGGYFDAKRDLPDLPLVLKNDDDSSNISSNALAGINLTRWSALLSQPERDLEARRLVSSFAHHVSTNPAAVAGLTLVVDRLLRPAGRVVLIGPASAPEIVAARRQIWACPGRRPSIIQIATADDRAWLLEHKALPPAVLSQPATPPVAFLLDTAAVKAGPIPLADLQKHLPSRPKRASL